MHKHLLTKLLINSEAPPSIAKRLMGFAILLIANFSINAHSIESNCQQSPKSCIEENTLSVGLSLGIGLRTNPLYESDNIPLIVLPQFSFYSGDFFVENLDIGYSLFQSSHTTVSAIATPSYDSVFFNRWDPGNVFVELSSSNGLQAAPPPTMESDRQTLIAPDELSERKFSYLGGIEVSKEIDSGLFQFSFLSDITNIHSGSEIRFAYAHIFTESFSTTFGFTWKDKDLTDYYYGIDSNEIVDDRGAYQANASLSPFVRASYKKELADGDSWRFSFEYQKLDSEISNSPIAVDDYVVTFFLGKTFKF